MIAQRDDPTPGSSPSATDGASTLVGVELRELFITKPGPEAGQRVDRWTVEELTEFERALGWLKEENL